MRKRGRTAVIWLQLICAVLLSGCRTLGDAALHGASVPYYAGAAVIAVPLWIVGGPFVVAEKVGERHDGVGSAIFSPSGKNIVITYRHGRYQRIYRATSDGAYCEQLTVGRRFDLDPVYSPDGTAIAFSSRRGWPRKRLYLFVMDADGSDLQQLTTTGSVASPGQFSPDGTKIVFAAYRRRGQADLFVVNVDSGELRQLTSCDCHDLHPQFLPDGETILFARATWYGHFSPIASSSWHHWGLYTTGIDGTAPTRLIQPCDIAAVSLSPDGEQIVYDTDDPWGIDLWLVSTEKPGKATQVMPESPKYWVYDEHGYLVSHMKEPQFSPDGQSILFLMIADPERSRWSGPYELHVLDLATGEARQITDLNIHIMEPRYSPDGSQILFRVDRKRGKLRTRYELWVVNADGSSPHRIELDIEK